MNVGERIKKRRLELGMTADQLAAAISKSRATIYRYENGDVEDMPSSVLLPLARALHTSPADLMGWVSNDQGDEICDYYTDQVERVIQVFENSGFKQVDVSTTGDPILLFHGKTGQWFSFYEGDLVNRLECLRIDGIDPDINTLCTGLRSSFSNEDAAAIEKAKSSQTGYYMDEETAALAQEMFEDPDMRSLFHMKRNMDPERFKTHMDFIKTLYKQEHPDDDDTGC